MRYVYTAVTAGRDALRSPGPLPPGWRAVCFTDAPAEHPDWDVRVLSHVKKDPVRTARRLKVLSHRALPDAELSLWVDGNVSVACDLDALVALHLADGDLALHHHPERDCAYEEGIHCIKKGKDDAATIVRHLLRYARAGYPEHAGLPATGVLLRRHTGPVRAFEQTWWHELAAGSRRDQISVGWALRAHGLDWSAFESHLWDGPLFRWRGHDGPGRADPGAGSLPAGAVRPTGSA